MRLVYFLLCLIYVESAKKLPSFVEPCYRSSPTELSRCIIQNIDNLRPRFPNGIPELQLPPLDPLVISSAVIAAGNTFSCDIKNVKLFHVNNMIIKYLQLDLDSKKWILEAEYSSLGIETDYHMKGKLLILELDSEGKAKGNMTGIKLKNTVQLNTVIKNGKEHLAIKNIDLTTTIDKAYFQFENLFKNNEELNNRANSILNENYKVFLDEFGPTIQDIIKTFMTQLFENLFNKYPYDVLYPKNKN